MTVSATFAEKTAGPFLIRAAFRGTKALPPLVSPFQKLDGIKRRSGGSASRCERTKPPVVIGHGASDVSRLEAFGQLDAIVGRTPPIANVKTSAGRATRIARRLGVGPAPCRPSVTRLKGETPWVKSRVAQFLFDAHLFSRIHFQLGFTGSHDTGAGGKREVRGRGGPSHYAAMGQVLPRVRHNKGTSSDRAKAASADSANVGGKEMKNGVTRWSGPNGRYESATRDFSRRKLSSLPGKGFSSAGTTYFAKRRWGRAFSVIPKPRCREEIWTRLVNGQ